MFQTIYINMKIIITEEQKKKLFIPRKIDEREIEAEKLKQKFISEIKEIIEEEGEISFDELDGDSPMFQDDLTSGLIAFFTNYKEDIVEITYYNELSGEEVRSVEIPYEKLNLQQLMEIRELLETYDAH